MITKRENGVPNKTGLFNTIMKMPTFNIQKGINN